MLSRVDPATPPVPLGTLRRRALTRGLRKRCPQCAERDLFLRFARLRERCPHCDLVLRREHGAQTGSMYLTAAVGQVFACAVIWAVWLATDWGVAVSIAVSLPLVLAFCVAFLPFSQSIWVAIEYTTDAVNGEEWVRQRS